MAQLQPQPQILGGASPRYEPLNGGDRPALLLLLNDASDRTRLAQHLTTAAADYRCLEAETLAKALDLWYTELPAWAVLDLAWAVGSGLAFLAALGENCPTHPLPVIVLVEQGQERAALDAMKLGAADYLFKTEFSPAALTAKLAQQQVLTETQAAHRQVTANRDVLAQVLGRINDGIIAFDRDSRCIYLNPSAKQILGRPALDLIGKHLWTEFPAAVNTPLYGAYHRAVEQQQPEFLKSCFLHLEGWFEVRLYPDENGITLYFTDIGDRRAAEASGQQTERLRQELTLLEQILDSVLAGYWDFDFQHDRAYYSPGLKAMFGYADDELPNQFDTWQALIFAEDIPSVRASLDRHIQSRGEVLHRVEVRYRHKNGSPVWVLCAGQAIGWDEAGQPLRMVGCHVDITPLKQTEAQLRENEAHLQSAQRISNLGSWEFELATGQITWSEQVYRIFGLTVAERPASFEVLQSYFHPDDRDRHRQTVEATMATCQPYNDEFRILRVDGSLGYIHVKGEAVVDALGQLTHLTGTVQDITERKQHEVQMQSLSLRLGLALESGRIGTWNWDLDQRVDWDQRMYDIYGLQTPGQAVTYQDWVNCLHPDDLPVAIAALQAALDGEAEYDIEFRCRRGDGELRWIRAAALVRRTPTGQPLEMIGINYDITEHKQAVLEFERLSLRLSLALESGCIGSWERVLSTDEVIWDECLVNLYGFDRLGRQATYQDWCAQVYADDLPWVEAATRDLLDSNTLYDVEFRIWRGDGSLGWIRSSALVHRDAQGQPLSIIGINYDITDHKQSAAELQGISARLSLALASGGFGSWEWDLGTDIVHWDQRLIDLYDFDRPNQPATYQDWRRRVYGKDLQTVESALQATLDHDVPYDVEFRICRRDGELRWIRSTALVQRDELGRPKRLIGTNSDITKAKQAEKHLLHTTVQLEVSNQELEAFAYSVSHDLRAPLRAIDGFSRAILEDYGDQFDPEGQDYFDRIRHNVSRMGQLIDDLLRLSRVSRQTMAYGVVNLSALVQEQIDELRTIDPDRAVTVTITPGIAVSADTTLMRIAIANLVQNAWKFTARCSSAQIEFGVTMPSGEPIYYLRDNGAGFDMAYADKLFGVFQRLHNTDEFPGTGIGLATVQRAIHRQGGRVWAKAAVDRGATFYFTLPQYAPGPVSGLSSCPSSELEEPS